MLQDLKLMIGFALLSFFWFRINYYIAYETINKKTENVMPMFIANGI